MVDGYCLDVIPCKIWKSYFEKQLSYGQYMVIWFGLVWLGLVWFGFEWYGTWVMSSITLLLKNNKVMDDLRIFGLVWYV